MRIILLEFVLGLLVSSSVWAGGSQMFSPATSGSRPDRLWEQDRGAALREYQQQLHGHGREVESLKHKPC